MPKVSVITPVFNAEKYISEVIQSVLSSTYTDFEYIIIDDGSTDGSLERIKKSTKTSFIDVQVISEKNSGEANAVNRAFQESSGDLILIVNADDPIKPTLVEELVAVLAQNPQCVVAYPNWEMIDATGALIKKVETLSYSQSALIGDFVCIPGPGAMFRRSALKGELPRNPKYKYVSDYELWLRLSLVGQFHKVPAFLATWRNHSNNATSSGKGMSQVKEILSVIEDFFESPNLPVEVMKLKNRARAHYLYYAAVQGLFNPEVPSRRYLFKSILTFYKPSLTRVETVKRNPIIVAAIFLRPLSTYLIKVIRKHKI